MNIYFSTAFFNLFVRKGGKKEKSTCFYGYVMNREKFGSKSARQVKKGKHLFLAAARGFRILQRESDVGNENINTSVSPERSGTTCVQGNGLPG